MKKKLYAHPDAVIAVLAIVFLFALIAFYFWATDAIVVQIRRSLTAAPQQAASGFDLDAASKLDLRGLLGQPLSSSSVDVAPAVTQTPVTVTPPPVVVAPPVTTVLPPAIVPTSTAPIVLPPPAVVATTTQGASTTSSVGATP
jgi:hypothetical protein